MKRFGKRICLISLVCLVFLAACGGQREPTATPIDQEAIFTAAAQTVDVQMTETAMAAISPTPETIATETLSLPTSTLPPGITPFSLGTPFPVTPGQLLTLPTVTPLGAGSGASTGGSGTTGTECDNSVFIADVTVPDGTEMKPGQDFKKTWSIQNTGTCTWNEGYYLAFGWGEAMQGQNWEIQKKKDFVEPGQTKEITVEMVAPDTAGDHNGCWRMKNDRDQFFGTALCVAIKVNK
jgi:hypothetical protein